MHRRTVIALLTGLPLLAVLPVFFGQDRPVSADRPGAKTWVGRHAEVEEYLRTAECAKLELLGPNRAARCDLRPGGPVARMAWKPLPPGVYRGFRESYKAEIAAYETDKLVQLDMVPPSVERQLDGKTGAAQLWVENVVDSTGEAPAPSHGDWETQLVRMRMFDNLIGYRDRNPANMLRDASWNLILIDHSRAFSASPELPNRLSRIDETLWERIQHLTRAQLDSALKAWLTEEELRAVLDRRERMKAEIRLLPR